jgi:LPS export ABC transporter permease LptF/LPS export ABC transporter permease LptG
MLKYFDRYMLREAASPFGIGLLVYSFVLLMNQLLVFPELFIAQGIPLLTTLKLLGYLVPAILAFTVPMAVLMGVLAGLSRMSSDAEITAFKTLGIGHLRILRPLLLFAFAGWLITSFLAMWMAPAFNYKFQQTLAAAQAERLQLQLSPREFIDISGTTIYFQDVAPNQEWTNVFIKVGIPPEDTRILLAERGRLIVSAREKRAVLELHNVVQHTISSDNPDRYSISVSARVEEEINAENYFGYGGAVKRVREMTLGELTAGRREIRTRMAALEMERASLAGSSDPAVYKKRADNAVAAAHARDEIRAHDVEIHKKFALPFACWIFVFLGLPLGISTKKGGRTSGFTLSLVIILFYYIFITAGEKFAMDGRIPPWLGIWGGNIIFAVLGAWMFVRSSREIPFFARLIKRRMLLRQARFVAATPFDAPARNRRGGILGKILALLFDLVLIAGFCLATLWGGARLMDIALFDLLFAAKVAAGIFFLILLFEYFFLATFFLGGTPGVRLFAYFAGRVRPVAATPVAAPAAPEASRRLRFHWWFPNILDRYVLRKYLAIGAFAMASLLAISAVVTFFEQIDNIYRNHRSISLLLSYIWFRVPEFIHFGLPVTALTATLLAFGLLTKSNEMTAMKACGISLYRIVLPAAVMGILLGFLGFQIQERILPQSSRLANEAWDRLNSSSDSPAPANFRPWAISRTGDRIFHYGYFDSHQANWSRFSIIDIDPTAWSIRRYVYADRAELRGDNVRLENGWLREIEQGEEARFDKFKVLDLPFAKDRELFYKKNKSPAQMTVAELNRHIEDVGKLGIDTRRLQVEAGKKLAFPFVALVMTFLGLPFAFLMGKRGALVGVGISLVIAIAYWVLIGVGISLGNVGFLSVFLATWGPNLIFGFLGLTLFMRVRT